MTRRAILKGDERGKAWKRFIKEKINSILKRYYRKDKDILLNPFDQNSGHWSPWAECNNALDYFDLAEAFIPHSNSEHENYWRIASKTVFVTLLKKIEDTKKTSEITRWMLYKSLANLCKIVEGTKAASHMDLNSEKTARSIRSVASTFLECLEQIKDTENPFSIKDWLKQNSGSWLFIQCTPSQRAMLRPLMTAWISSAIRGLLSARF